MNGEWFLGVWGVINGENIPKLSGNTFNWMATISRFLFFKMKELIPKCNLSFDDIVRKGSIELFHKLISCYKVYVQKFSNRPNSSDRTYLRVLYPIVEFKVCLARIVKADYYNKHYYFRQLFKTASFFHCIMILLTNCNYSTTQSFEINMYEYILWGCIE